jgi:methylated-DNA-[protein]-cysteine S-methyltransferase
VLTPIGPLFIEVVDAGAITRLGFDDPDRPIEDHPEVDKRVVPDRITQQLRGYFAGSITSFELPLSPAGTDFQRRVWDALQRVPFGETTSYGQLAGELGSVARAVGGANARNPIALVVPCHRVIGGDGALTGYAYGTERKRWLLAHEARLAGRLNPSADLFGP